jgi:hypothetical protein
MLLALIALLLEATLRSGGFAGLVSSARSRFGRHRAV